MANQADRYAALRTRLINAAERTIAERGLAALKARDLAAEAGCAIGTIYNVFEHLDELVLAVGSRTLAMLDAALEAARSRGPYSSAEEAIADLVRLALAYLDFAARHQVRWRALFEHRISGAHSLSTGMSNSSGFCSRKSRGHWRCCCQGSMTSGAEFSRALCSAPCTAWSLSASKKNWCPCRCRIYASRLSRSFERSREGGMSFPMTHRYRCRSAAINEASGLNLT